MKNPMVNDNAPVPILNKGAPDPTIKNKIPQIPQQNLNKSRQDKQHGKGKSMNSKQV